MAPEFLVLALEYYRRPLHFRSLSNPGTSLPASFGALVRDLGGALAPGRIQETAAALGASPEELRAAAQFMVRQVLLRPPANHYRVLGVSRRADAALIGEHYHVLVRLFHPDRQPPAERARGAEDTARITAAYRVLKQSESRGRYDQELDGHKRDHRPRRRMVSRRRAPPALIESRTCWSRRGKGQWAVMGVVGIGIIAGLTWSVLTERTTLHVTAEENRTAKSKPGFLSTAPRPNPSPAVANSATTTTRSPARPHDGTATPGAAASATTATPSSATTHSGAASPEWVLQQLKRHFRVGDLAAILRLMAHDARITNAGTLDPTAGGDLFQGALDKRLHLGDLSLTRLNSERFRAGGSLALVSARTAGNQRSQAASAGRILLEMVREDGAYLISALDYRFDSQDP